MSDQAHYTCEAVNEENAPAIQLIPSPPPQIFCSKNVLEYDTMYLLLPFHSFHLAFPEIINSGSTLDPVVGEVLGIECQVRGTPIPVVDWTKDSIPLSSTSGIFISISMEGVSRVTIDRASADDIGLYRCTATNSAGSVNRTIRIDSLQSEIFGN